MSDNAPDTDAGSRDAGEAAPTPWGAYALAFSSLVVGIVAIGQANAAGQKAASLAAAAAKESADRTSKEIAALRAAVERIHAASAPPVRPAVGPSGLGGESGESPNPSQELADLRADVDMLSATTARIERSIKDLADRVNFGGGAGALDGNPFGGLKPGEDPGGASPGAAQPVLTFTPELRESLRKAVAAKGVELLEDRVIVPGVLALKQGALEFLAVFAGGKVHESIFLLTGTPEEEGQRVEGLGAALNSSLMALGLKPGTPIRFLPEGKTVPATGTPVEIAVEWEEDGKTVRVRAEDLLWDRANNRSMESGRFLYVGSWFHVDGYVPDLTGDAIAVYSVQSCIIDLADPRAADDTEFMACAPRLPDEGTRIRMVFSPKPLAPTRTWDPADPQKRTDGGK